MKTTHKWVDKDGRMAYAGDEGAVCQKCGSSDSNTPCTEPLDADDKRIAEMYSQGHTVSYICGVMNQNNTKGWGHFNLNAIRSRIRKIRKFALGGLT